ncbi:MAG: pentapeptide repeat-containing protein [Symploca sp. SIO2C1]|nr:pentapeptide repeat-containing protein [Symploca sp. SIO2C1]
MFCKEFRPVELFERLEDFYQRWCEGEFIDIPEETLLQKTTRRLQNQGISLGQRQVDIYTGLNVMILLLELHRYAQGKDELKDKVAFYPCDQLDSKDFEPERLLRIMSYSNSVNLGTFRDTVGLFLGDANLSHANLSRTELSGANLSDANLSRANLIGTELSSANLSGAGLSGTKFSGADLRGAELRMANIIGAELSGANLIGAYLSGAKLSGAKLSGANLIGAYLSGTDLNGANLNRANLIGAYLSCAKLNGAKLNGANLNRANLIGANLSGTNLSGTNLSDANLSDADLRGANLRNISWDEKTNWGNVKGLETAVDVPIALLRQLL